MERLVVLHRRPNFRSEKWVRPFDLTRQFIHRLYDNSEVFGEEAIEIYFPERFLNSIEVDVFVDKLKSQAGKSKLLIVHTHSEIIMRAAWQNAIEVGEACEDFEGTAEPYSEEIPSENPL